VAPSNVIFNADDFGAGTGINQGIADCHARGVLTSTSLMVDGAAAQDAARLSREHPRLAVGLHFDVTGEGERPPFAMHDLGAVRRELERQLDAFERLMGRAPTHVDSHQHVHRWDGVAEVFAEVVAPLGVPVRDDGRVTHIGGFYGQWEPPATDLYHVSVEFAVWILENEVLDPWVEIGCHPGYVSRDFTSTYLTEREAEVRTLTDPRLRAAVDRLELRLASFADL
jgi:chitin disaccharide deacetylase